MYQPFRPAPGSTIRITASTGATPAPLVGLPAGGGGQARVRNRGSVEAYVEFGGTTVTAAVPGATGGSMGIAAGGVEVFTVQQTERHIAVAVESGTPSVEVTCGSGD